MPEGKAEEVVAIGHRHPLPAPGTANEAISWVEVGKLFLTAGTMFPGFPSTVFSTKFIAVQLWEGDKTGALLTALQGTLNLTGMDVAALNVVLNLKKETGHCDRRS